VSTHNCWPYSACSRVQVMAQYILCMFWLAADTRRMWPSIATKPMGSGDEAMLLGDGAGSLPAIGLDRASAAGFILTSTDSPLARASSSAATLRRQVSLEIEPLWSSRYMLSDKASCATRANKLQYTIYAQIAYCDDNSRGLLWRRMFQSDTKGERGSRDKQR
jgi:hypothetical protein